MRAPAIVLLLSGTIAVAQPAPVSTAELSAAQKLFAAGDYAHAFNRILHYRQAAGRSFYVDYWLARIACSFAEKRADGQRLLVAMQTDYAAGAASAAKLNALAVACGVTPPRRWAQAAGGVESTSATGHPVIPAFAGAAGASTHSRPRPQREFAPVQAGVASMSNPD